MPKTYEEIQTEVQKRIEVAMKKKDVRQSKTEISIGLRWAINCAVNFVPEEMKGTAKGFRLIEKWYEKFMDLDRNYMLENMPIEQPQKLTGKDFAIAKSLANESEAITAKAEELRQEEKSAEEKIEIDNLPIINKNEA